MPLYDYKCKDCSNTHEEFYQMDSCPRRVRCKCGGWSYKVCNAGGFQPRYGRAGGLQDDHPAWLASSIDHLQNPQDAKRHPIDSRSAMYNYMKMTNTRFKEPGHKVTPKQGKPITEDTRQKAIEAVKKAGHEARSITVNL